MKKVLITDLDDTIWNWFKMWYESSNNFYNNIIQHLGKDPEKLYKDFRAVHQKYHTSEASHEIDEIESLTIDDINFIRNKAFIGNKTIMHKYNSDRVHNLMLYPNVLETLEVLRSKNIKIIGFTESNTFHTLKRIKQLGLESFFDSIYAPIDLGKKDMTKRFYQKDQYISKSVKLNELPKGTKKPNKDVLLTILKENNFTAEDAIYVGDKLQKDIVMANDANVFSVHAKYGDIPIDESYKLLQKVSHWSEEDVQYEAKIKKQTAGITIEPNLEITNFNQILNLF
ncbi:HAD family hydrolase [Sphingobacterium sp. 18053]|uniref:HAD family hydrolase n=1 Tax=Sphingobacterium sp. 18053 TaxID=2681401 RepID=UPI0013583390|nr:HAD hydrolase-like protein [Sphingobacterium sp. 18053]